MLPALFEDVPPEIIERFEQRDSVGILLPSSPHGQRLSSTQYAEVLQSLSDREDEPLALYIHIPFCPVRCLYCACHTTITHDATRIDHYLDSLGREMDLVAERLGNGRELYQLHLGGGTPNYLSDSQLVRLMELVGRHFRLRSDADTVIECNPRRCSEGQLELLHSLGFKRISFGVQDLNPVVQQAIGRINSYELVCDVHETARGLGFESTCMELVYGLPRQSPQGFRETLERMVGIGPDRIGCYSYAHRPAAHPNQYAIESGDLPGPADKLAMLHEAVSCLGDAGYSWIGTDCFVRRTDPLSLAQAARRLGHNCMGYTSVPSQHLLALGMSSLGEVDGAFVQNEPSLNAWSAALSDGRLPISWGHQLGEDAQRRRDAYRQLICNLELPMELAKGLGDDYERLRSCSEHGLVEETDDRLHVTDKGRYFLRVLCCTQDPALAWSGKPWGLPRAV